MVVNSLPTQEVSAIGRKLAGVVGSSMAEPFPTSLIAASFHSGGITAWDQQQLNRLKRALPSERHCLKTV